MFDEKLLRLAISHDCDNHLKVRFEAIISIAEKNILNDDVKFEIRKELELLGVINAHELHKQDESVIAIDTELGFINWIIRKIAMEDCINIVEIEIYLYIIQVIDQDESFWNALKLIGLEPRSAFFSLASKAVSSASGSIEYRHTTDYHKEERAKIYKSNLENHNWYAIYEDLHRCGDEIKFSFGSTLIQSVYILNVYRESDLKNLLEQQKDVTVCWGVSDLLGARFALNLANSTHSELLQFCCLASTLKYPLRYCLTDEILNILKFSFVILSKDLDKFKHWMDILNKYPLRYPYIQPVLGEALAEIGSDEAVDIYLKAINMRSREFDDPCRFAVTECLRSFKEHADIDFCRKVWDKCFNFWREWNFSHNANRTEYLFKVQCSVLDFGVVNYFTHNCSSDNRSLLVEEHKENLYEINNTWHIDLTAYETYWYRQLSLLQPILHADFISQNINGNYLQLENIYLFTVFKENDYYKRLINH